MNQCQNLNGYDDNKERNDDIPSHFQMIIRVSDFHNCCSNHYDKYRHQQQEAPSEFLPEIRDNSVFNRVFRNEFSFYDLVIRMIITFEINVQHLRNPLIENITFCIW